MKKPLKIYVASSWRNAMHPAVVHILRRSGHTVYDYRHPEPGSNGFKWNETDLPMNPSNDDFLKALDHPLAVRGYNLDMAALIECDALVLVLTSGNSAHLETGFAIGREKLTVILLDDETRPDLMYKMANHIITSPDQLFDIFGEPVPT